MAFLDSRVNRIVVPLVYLPLLVAALGAASPPAPLFRHEPLNVANGCFVESVYFYDQFQERFGGNAWVRVLQWGAMASNVSFNHDVDASLVTVSPTFTLPQSATEVSAIATCGRRTVEPSSRCG